MYLCKSLQYHSLRFVKYLTNTTYTIEVLITFLVKLCFIVILTASLVTVQIYRAFQKFDTQNLSFTMSGKGTGKSTGKSTKTGESKMHSTFDTNNSNHTVKKEAAIKEHSLLKREDLLSATIDCCSSQDHILAIVRTSVWEGPEEN
eukprot:Awhi_evm1s2134